jgi:integrase
MLSVLFCACLRREEIVAVDVEDVSNGVIQADNRIVYLPPGAREAVDLWVETRGIVENEPALFVLGRQGYQLKRLTEGDVLAILNRVALRARVRPFTPADLSQKRNTV